VTSPGFQQHDPVIPARRALAVGSAAVVAAPAADPVIGNWQLNVAKSKFSPGPAPKSETRTYAARDQGITMTWKSVGADGATPPTRSS
jgi:hypothetical protein